MKTQVRKPYGKVQKEDHAKFATAICMGNSELLQTFEIATSTITNYISYAKASRTNRTKAQIIYRGLSHSIRRHIDKCIDNGIYADCLAYNKPGITEPRQIGPNKETTVAKPVQLSFLKELKEQQKQNTPLNTDRIDETIKLLFSALESIQLLLRKL